MKGGYSSVAYGMDNSWTLTTSGLWEHYSGHCEANNSACLLASFKLMIHFYNLSAYTVHLGFSDLKYVNRNSCIKDIRETSTMRTVLYKNEVY